MFYASLHTFPRTQKRKVICAYNLIRCKLINLFIPLPHAYFYVNTMNEFLSPCRPSPSMKAPRTSGNSIKILAMLKFLLQPRDN